MPCCGLHEYRERVPLKYTLAGMLVFWGAFVGASVLGILLCWTRMGRSLLACQWEFLRSIWKETMRDRDSVPARWSCRLSGYVLPIWPGLAETVYRRPEVLFLLTPCILLGATATVTWLVCQFV